MKEQLHTAKKAIKKLTNKLMGKGLRAEVKKYKQHSPEKEHCGDEKIGENIYLYWWKTEEGLINLGDYLSSIVVKHFAPATGGRSEKTTLFAIGSIIGFRVQTAVVWGSGFLHGSDRHRAKAKCSHLDVRAVRGPRTYRMLKGLGIKCPRVFGDPGVLMPLIYQPTDTEKAYEATVIPHYAHPINIPENMSNVNTVSMLTSEWEGVIDSIVKSKRVISGSLHGIILAEAYGVPAVLIQADGKAKFKYKDYYNGTGRYRIVVARTVEEAMRVTPMRLPDIDIIQKRLLAAFPYDLWNNQ